MIQDIHNRFRTSHAHKITADLLFAGLVLTSLNLGLFHGPAKSASADAVAPEVATTASTSTAESTTQTLKPTTGLSTNQPTPTSQPNFSDGTDASSAEVTNTTATNHHTDASATDNNSSSTDTDATVTPDTTQTRASTAESGLSGTVTSASNHTNRLAEKSKTRTPSTTSTLAAKAAFTAKANDASTTERLTSKAVVDDQANATTSPTVQTGTVYVYYKTDTGGELHKEVLTGTIGKTFTAEALKFDDGDPKDFLLKGANKITGTYTAASQTVTFTYQIPRVHATTQNGMNLFTTTYADGSLKFIEIFDDDFDITLAKTSTGRSFVTIRSIFPTGITRGVSLANQGVATNGKRFGYFNTPATSFIFEKSDNSRSIKVLKINNQTGKLTVTTINLATKGAHASAAAKALGLHLNTSFAAFWRKFVSGDTQTNSATRETDTTPNRLRSKSASSKSNLPDRTKLPQTSEAQAGASIYGYVTLLLLSVVGLFKKAKKD